MLTGLELLDLGKRNFAANSRSLFEEASVHSRRFVTHHVCTLGLVPLGFNSLSEKLPTELGLMEGLEELILGEVLAVVSCFC